MEIIVEPKNTIKKLWSIPQNRNNIVFRLMHYVIRVDHRGKVLLQNVVTGELACLSEEEVVLISMLPLPYQPLMDDLINNHFLVREDYDEHCQVAGMREIIRKLDRVDCNKPITGYTILPTTACNARCYYCFEQGSKICTMSKRTAEEVVGFIDSHRGDRTSVTIIWFGGEPTIAIDRIDQICEGLIKRSVKIHSKMITNGFLFDEKIVEKAKKVWNLEALQICVDGTESNYNNIKNYVNPGDNPYERVMRNVGLLLDNGIRVGLRMNFDINNYQDFYVLLEEIGLRFGNNPFLGVGVHPIIGEYCDRYGVIHHGTDDWFSKKLVELHKLIGEKGLNHQNEMRLPYLNYEACSAYSDSTITITPEGGLVKCPEQFGEDQFVGNVIDGIINHDLVDSWKEVADFQKCRNCVFFPSCLRLKNCSNTSYCHKELFLNDQCRSIVKQYYDNVIGSGSYDMKGE